MLIVGLIFFLFLKVAMTTDLMLKITFDQIHLYKKLSQKQIKFIIIIKKNVNLKFFS